MKVDSFLGGTDVQRSLNLADSRCVNLYATTDDSGSVSGFYSTPGLAPYASAASPFSGIYTASNGRCFAVSGTILYEITAGGVLTNRGTVTAGTVSRMSDNGIEMIIVNGTDGWLFTFATNALKKISVNSKDFTVTIASPAVFTTVADHGLVVGDAIQLTTTTGQNTVSGELTAMPSQDIPSFSDGITISPDGLNAYIVYRNNATGSQLDYCYINQYAIDSNGTLSPLSTPTIPFRDYDFRKLVISADGKFAYAPSYRNPNGFGGAGDQYKGIAIFIRDISTGFLTFINQVDVGVIRGYNIDSIALTDEGAAPSLYASSYGSGHLIIYQFGRNLGTGDLTAYGTPTVAGTSTAAAIIATSADGLGVYATSNTYSGTTAVGHLQGFLRNLTTGLLTPLTEITTDIAYPSRPILSIDNAFVYVASGMTSTIRKYSRVPATGVVTFVNSVAVGNTGYTAIGDITISPEGTSIYCGINPGNAIYQFDRSTTTGDLTPTANPSVAADVGIWSIITSPLGKNVYATSLGELPYKSKLMTYSRQQSATEVGLPTGLDTLTTYYVIAAGLTAKNFEVSLTAGGAAVNTSGVQAGIHTYHTIGNGFPDGCKTVSYIDGRFVVCEPNSQNFFVSDVLKGDAWDALNVQTADSNPDKIVGQVTLHNELIVFCEQSGETFYDSGTYPAPFVRNVSGIFEVGCIAPYSIAKIDNSVMWLGRSSTGQGIIYRLNGYTPVRLSTYAIEYAIQNMTTISDAQAFTYQQEGHHFYVITFPTGGRTFAFDVNTSLWHERAGWSGTALTRWAGQEYAYFDGKHLVCDYASGNIYSMDLGVYTDGGNARKWIRSFRAPSSEMKRVIHNKLTLEAEVGVGSVIVAGSGSVSSISMSNNGSSVKTLNFASENMPSSQTWMGVAWSGTKFCAVAATASAVSTDGINWSAGALGVTVGKNVVWNGTLFVVAYRQSIAVFTSPDGITWTSRNPNAATDDIGYGGGKCVILGNNGGTIQGATSTDGINWAPMATPPTISPYRLDAHNNSIIYNGTIWCVMGVNSSQGAVAVCATSTDGLNWTNRTMPSSQIWTSVAWNGTVFCAISTGTAVAATSADGIVWAAQTLPAALGWTSIINAGGMFVLTSANGNHYSSLDGVTWTAATGAGIGLNCIAYNGTNLAGVGTGSSSSFGTLSYAGAGTYSITFTGGTGVGAAGTYTISATTGQIDPAFTVITSGGTGYGLVAPTPTFIYGGIVGASGTANMTYTYQSPMVSLKYSNDGGHTWSADNWRDMSMGTLGQYSKRVYWYRLGMTTGQTRLYELSSTSPTKVALLGAYLE